MNPELQTIQNERMENPWKQAVKCLLYTGYWVSDRLNEQLKPFGLSEQQFSVLEILKQQKDLSSNLCDIQEQMLHKMSNATRLVEKLRLKGLVTREIREDNRRMVDITITAKGLTLLDRIQKKLSEFQCEYENKLTDNEYSQLSELLNKLRK
jgi:DNA-binding MarR family transcriptional regulator